MKRISITLLFNFFKATHAYSIKLNNNRILTFLGLDISTDKTPDILTVHKSNFVFQNKAIPTMKCWLKIVAMRLFVDGKERCFSNI